MSEKDFLDQIAEACGGTITEVQHLPDGSGKYQILLKVTCDPDDFFDSAENLKIVEVE